MIAADPAPLKLRRTAAFYSLDGKREVDESRSPTDICHMGGDAAYTDRRCRGRGDCLARKGDRRRPYHNKEGEWGTPLVGEVESSIFPSFV